MPGAGLEPARPQRSGEVKFPSLLHNTRLPPKHKSNALPSCDKLLLDIVIVTYGQHSVSEIHLPEGANCRYDCDGYRADTWGVELGRPVSCLAVWEPVSYLLLSSRPSRSRQAFFSFAMVITVGLSFGGIICLSGFLHFNIWVLPVLGSLQDHLELPFTPLHVTTSFPSKS